MAITLIVTRSIDHHYARTGEKIPLQEWLKLIEGDPELRIRTDPVTITNPQTKQVITIPVHEGQTELAIKDGYELFLSYRGGELVMDRSAAALVKLSGDETDPTRRKVAQIARRLGAVITHDAGDEILKW